jgi:hypothetical protein
MPIETFLENCRQVIRLKQLSYRTEETLLTTGNRSAVPQEPLVAGGRKVRGLPDCLRAVRSDSEGNRSQLHSTSGRLIASSQQTCGSAPSGANITLLTLPALRQIAGSAC